MDETTLRIKTITATVERKLNPKLFSRQREYESLAASFGAWADIPEGEDVTAAQIELNAFVRVGQVALLREMVASIRATDTAMSKLVPLDAVITAAQDAFGDDEDALAGFRAAVEAITTNVVTT